MSVLCFTVFAVNLCVFELAQPGVCLYTWMLSLFLYFALIVETTFFEISGFVLLM